MLITLANANSMQDSSRNLINVGKELRLDRNTFLQHYLDDPFAHARTTIALNIVHAKPSTINPKIGPINITKLLPSKPAISN